MGQTATKFKKIKSPHCLEEKTQETGLPCLTDIHTTTTEPKETKWPPRLEEKTGLPLLTDVHRTGKELGRGQSSVVEEVVYNGEVCAMKVPATSHKKYMLLEEAEILAALKHPHIMKLIGVTAIGHDERMSLVLEKGATTLRHFLSSIRKEVVPPQLKVQILQQVSEAVQYLHTQEPPIVHGDITGTNIYLTDQYQVKLGDFGSAYREGGPPSAYREENRVLRLFHTSISIFDVSAISKTGSDIFAFGALIIEVVSHQQPIPTEYIDMTTLLPYTEYQRRQKYVDQFSAEEKEHFIPTIKQCLTESQEERPHASNLVERLQQIRTALGISNKLVTAENLNLPFSMPASIPLQKTAADSFKDLQQFKLDDVHQTGVELGGGSFSVVYEVKWSQRICAAKHFVVFGHKPEATDQIVQSLLRECRHWLELKHPHIVETLGWYEK